MAVFNIGISLRGIKNCLLLTLLMFGFVHTGASQTADTIHKEVPGTTRVNTKDGMTYVWIAPGSRRTLPSQSRVVRGGTWAVSADKVRVSFRGRDEPANAYYTIGFRCVGDLS